MVFERRLGVVHGRSNILLEFERRWRLDGGIVRRPLDIEFLQFPKRIHSPTDRSSQGGTVVVVIQLVHMARYRAPFTLNLCSACAHTFV